MSVSWLAERGLVCVAVACLAGSLAPASAAGQVAFGQASASAELRQIYEEEQAHRRTGRSDPDREKDRRARVVRMVRMSLLATADDYYHAAMVMQHSIEARDHLLAHALATAAAFMGHPRAKWLSAAALDRYLEWSGEQQFFGTQFTRNEEGVVEPGPYDPRLTDALRTEFGLPSLAEMQQRAATWNRSSR